MQKAIIIQSNYTYGDNGWQGDIKLDADELNSYLSQGWVVVQMSPIGASVAESGAAAGGAGVAGIIVIIEQRHGMPSKSLPRPSS